MPVLKDDLVVEKMYVEKNNQVTCTCSERLCAERTTPCGKKCQNKNDIGDSF